MTRLASLNIPQPCPESWSRMSGDDARRFCGVCAKDVTNLSACTREEAETFLRENPGACVRVWLDAAGRTLHRPVHWARLGTRFAAAVSAGALLQSCATAEAEPPPLMGKVAMNRPVGADGGTPEAVEHVRMGEVAAPPAHDARTVMLEPEPERAMMGAPAPQPLPKPPPMPKKTPTKK